MLIGKFFLIYDNDSYMLGEETKNVDDPKLRKYMDWRFLVDGELHPATCRSCGRKIETNYLNPNFKLNKKRMSLSATYDGYVIASKKFKTFVEQKGFSNILFRSLPSVKGHYQFITNNVLKYDMESRYLKLEDFCDSCKSYCSITSPAAVLADVCKPLEKGIYRTDLEFGTSYEQTPILITDIQTANEMDKAFKDIDFDDLYSKDDIK